MRIDLEQKNEICILRFHGRLVAGVDPEVMQAKADEIKKLKCPKVLADIRDMSAIGSTGLGFLVAMYSSALKVPGGHFVLVGPQPRVKEVLDLTRLSTIIPTFADLDSGLKALLGAAAANDAG